jgi:hypothetical protein
MNGRHGWDRALVVLALAVTSACGVGSQPTAEAIDDDRVPFDLLDPEAEPIVEPGDGDSEPVPLCYISDERLVVVDQPLDPPVSPGDAVAALSVLPDAEGSYRTAIPDADLIRSVDVSGGIARVDVRPSMSQLGGDDQLLAVAQIVCTLTYQPGIGQVAFTLDGIEIDVPRADGALVSQPVARDDYTSLLADAPSSRLPG